MVDEATKRTLASIPLLRTNASPRDGDLWATRLKEEYISLIKVRKNSLAARTLTREERVWSNSEGSATKEISYTVGRNPI